MSGVDEIRSGPRFTSGIWSSLRGAQEGIFNPFSYTDYRTYMKPFYTIPFETRPSDRYGYEVFRELIWHSSEVCNSCFTKVRSVGPERSKWIGRSYIKINEWYERTDLGSQEHSPGDFNRRFGTCYCLECGHDCNGDHSDKTISEMVPLVKNIFLYTKRESDFNIDGSEFGKEVRELKKLPAAQHHGTEVMAIGFARALEYNRTDGEDGNTAMWHDSKRSDADMPPESATG